MQGRMIGLAVRSYSKLADLCRYLSDEGGWKEKDDICLDIARTVKHMYHVLARMDSNVDRAEHTTLRALIDIDKTYDGDLERVWYDEPCRLTMDLEVPSVLSAAMEFDAREGTRVADELMDAFETLGYAIIGSDGVLTTSELVHLIEFVQAMHRFAHGPDQQAEELELASV